MPWSIEQREGRFCVVKEGADAPLKCYDTEAEARKYQAALYANEPDAKKDAGEGLLIAIGGAVKALGAGRIGGFLVSFGDETTPDLSAHRDFFTPETDFDIDEWPAKSTTYYRHGLDPEFGARRLPRGTMELKDSGVWFETQLRIADEYEAKILKLVEAGKIRLSSGTLNHLVKREPIKTAGGETVHRITYWPLGKDSSLAPDAADYRNAVVAIKALPEFPGLSEMAAGLKAEPPRSLAENTELWLDRGQDLLSQYRRLGEAEVKAGRAMSAARLQRLQQAHELIGQIIAECRMPEEDMDEAPGMGAKTDDLARQVEHLRLRTRAFLATQGGHP